MDCHRLGPSELPHTSRLYRAYLEDFTRVRGFYAHPPTEQGILEAVRENHTGNPDQAARRILTEVLQEQNQRFGAGEPALRNIERLANGAVAVVTGQQVGLFSGPSYSFYKALSVIRVAEGLTEQGVDAVPVFWLATEDHDLAEVNHCLWLSRRGLERLELPITGDGRRVGAPASRRAG